LDISGLTTSVFTQVHRIGQAHLQVAHNIHTANLHYYTNFLKMSKGVFSSSRVPISELRSVTYHMGSHSVTCHWTQVNAHTALA